MLTWKPVQSWEDLGEELDALVGTDTPEPVGYWYEAIDASGEVVEMEYREVTLTQALADLIGGDHV